MEITVKLGKEEYFIEVEPSSFNAYKVGTNEKTGNPTKISLGFFSNMTSAVKKITQNHLSELDEVITLKEYAERVENSYKTLMEQIEA